MNHPAQEGTSWQQEISKRLGIEAADSVGELLSGQAAILSLIHI